MSAGAGANKVLTTDASGVASWQTPAGGGKVPWSDVTSKPTTVAGYGITDMGSQNVNYAATAGIASSVSCTNCLTTTQVASADYATTAGSAPKGTLTCTTVTIFSYATKTCTCPTGYTVTGCVQGGINYGYSPHTSYFIGNACVCTGAGGSTCEARCCKIQ